MCVIECAYAMSTEKVKAIEMDMKLARSEWVDWVELEYLLVVIFWQRTLVNL